MRPRVYITQPVAPSAVERLRHTELRKAMANVVADNVLAVLDGRQPPNCWNPQIYATPG